MFTRRLSCFTATLMLGACALLPAAAQNAGPGSHKDLIVQKVIHLPSVPVKVNLLVMPEGAETARQEKVRLPFASSDPVSYSTYAKLVNVFDLAALISAFDAAEGDPNYLPTADLVRTDSATFNATDGFVDVFDLAALIEMLNF